MNEKTTIQRSLDGLRVGDAFGFKLSIRPAFVAERNLPEGPWYWSDDTAMASRVATVLLTRGQIDQDELFAEFVACFEFDPRRGYGGGMKRLLGKTAPDQWREAAPRLFMGQGSFGNGAAMRAPVLGAYFASDLDQVVTQAILSAQVTHTHPEGIAGAIAIACATAIKSSNPDIQPTPFLEHVASLTPDSQVKEGLIKALEFEVSDFDQAVEVLGNGYGITAPDTVPFCTWWAAHAPDSFEETMWRLVAIGGDEDTNCAIVGGILGAAGVEPPESWMSATEEQPDLMLFTASRDSAV